MWDYVFSHTAQLVVSVGTTEAMVTTGLVFEATCMSTLVQFDVPGRRMDAKITMSLFWGIV